MYCAHVKCICVKYNIKRAHTVKPALVTTHTVKPALVTTHTVKPTLVTTSINLLQSNLL